MIIFKLLLFVKYLVGEYSYCLIENKAKYFRKKFFDVIGCSVGEGSLLQVEVEGVKVFYKCFQ
jgi:hypothetical protein